jgi:TM2 domain-containing membrane protein YozV
LEKARCYEEASMPEEALRTLERIRLYLLDPGEVPEILVFKSRCSKETGDWGAALGFLEESGLANEYPSVYAVLLAASWRFSEAEEQALKCALDESEKEKVIKFFRKAPKLKKEGTAAALSFLPPAGQLYLGEPAQGLLSLLLNAGAVGFTVLELLEHNWVTGLLGGGLLLNETFFKGNISRNVSEVDAVNKRSVEEFALSLEYLLYTMGYQADSVFPGQGA